ncbi:MAG: tetraacyldisaccharide 4'-kinase [Bacteroidales bacterium]|nr:tetraacyldisaccharide 4'-kinase [Bacteroidales bacterium]
MANIGNIFAFPYALGLWMRNKAYDKGWLKSVKFDNVSIISFGNITVGGTGKTPHVELFIRELLERAYRVAVISRGYGRKNPKTSRFVETDSRVEDVGDEPLQIKRKFPQVKVIVDRDRVRAVKMLMALPFGDVPEVILLDDGMQYRRLLPTRQICLINYNRPVFKDCLLPFGRLRDLPSQLKRADTVIITKCPPYLNEWEKQQAISVNRINPQQKVFFTTVQYFDPVAVFPEGNNRYIYSHEAILFTGIANSDQLRHHVSARYPRNFHIEFDDHHVFTDKDIKQIEKFADKHPQAILLTTEKDSQRLRRNPAVHERIKEKMFYIPIEIGLVEDETTEGLYDVK